jgi:probable F420-dependent oxidoreductase
MKFSINMPGLIRFPPAHYRPDVHNWEATMTVADLQEVARTADRLGFDAITVPEHMVLPRGLATNMGGYFPDALTAMAWIAGATSDIRVRSGVMVLPYHPPIQLAKAVATLDVLSGGRVMLSVGVGMAEGEFHALGVPFARRGRVTDEYVEAMKVLWTDDDPEFSGAYVRFSDVVFEPKPVQKPHPPLWFGGRSAHALRRALRLGDGWSPDGAQSGTGPWLNSVEELPSFIAKVADAAGLEVPERFDIALPLELTLLGPDHEMIEPALDLSTPQAIIDRIGRLRELGATWSAVPAIGDTPMTSRAQYLEHLEWWATEIIAHVRA